ncbi:uncharacterized protein E0L32_011204 [Thyridium curvatum]|uniref:Uncharacterized protein n=1 Tax=Thyridium curvatum TaxID=1093900 RepID=A0A507BP81_9PEZI|nr:uncharacterized protein E0L32_011204 [Thyridium curvatum]TPX19131.1 hypothetical protein E0L32_011204 [Thyridium curvatum]
MHTSVISNLIVALAALEVSAAPAQPKPREGGVVEVYSPATELPYGPTAFRKIDASELVADEATGQLYAPVFYAIGSSQKKRIRRRAAQPVEDQATTGQLYSPAIYVLESTQGNRETPSVYKPDLFKKVQRAAPEA